MSTTVTERTGTIPTTIELAVKLATGLLIVSAAFLILLAINVAVVPPETALQMFQQ
jgi:hypothetical protein